MKSTGFLLKAIEFMGICVLILVVLALVSTPYFFTSQNPLITLATWVMSLMIGVLATTSLVRLANYTSYHWLVILGTTLITVGGAVFFFVPQFFFKAVSIPFPFWYRVTLYTLPAICVEGGILTLFTVFMEQSTMKTHREKLLLSVLFFLYAMTMVTTNFLVIGSIIPVSGHLVFSRIVLATVGILVGYLAVNHSKSSRTL